MNALRSHPLLSFLIVLALLVLNGAILHAIFEPEQDTLTVSFLDVGQGDAILIESSHGLQMLIDGGRDRSVLRELPRIVGPLDRTLDLVLATHPDADHIGGLPDVLARYRVSYYVSPGIENDTGPTKRLDEYVRKEAGMESFLVRRGMRIYLGDAVYADVLYPDRDVSKGETNAGSVVVRVVYGDTSFLLTGDAPDSVEEYLVHLDAASLDSDVLKAGHHGSRSSTAASFLTAVTPQTVVISAGKDNSYGHPHEEVTDRVQGVGAALVSTIEDGTITFTSDGKRIVRD